MVVVVVAAVVIPFRVLPLLCRCNLGSNRKLKIAVERTSVIPQVLLPVSFTMRRAGVLGRLVLGGFAVAAPLQFRLKPEA